MAAEFSALPMWCSQTVPTTTGRDRARRARVVHFPCALVSFPDQWEWYLAWERDFVCAFVQNLKMASFTTNSYHRVLWMALSARVNLRLWIRWVVEKLHAVMSIRLVLKSRWVLEQFSSYLCLTKWSEQRKNRAVALTSCNNAPPTSVWQKEWDVVRKQWSCSCLTSSISLNRRLKHAI